MADILSRYCARFGQVTTFGMPLDASDLQALLQKALDDDRAVDWVSIIGYDPCATLFEKDAVI